MSIILINKKDQKTTNLKTQSQFVNATILKKLFSYEMKINLNQIYLYHMGTYKQYGKHQVIRQGQTVQYFIKNINQIPSESLRKKGIVYAEELQKIIENSKIIIIKSANQQNIQKSKDLSLWATTFSNQERLKYFFNHFKHVLLIFATNRSFQIKGLARMQSEPDKVIDKSVWAGVANIRLGGNFKIKWLRKKPLSLVHVQKVMGISFKETIIKSSDGQQLDPQICRKIAYLLETPEQSYYPLQQKKLLQPQLLSQIQNKSIKTQSSNFSLSSLPPFFTQSFPNILPVSQIKNLQENSNESDIISEDQQSSSKKKKKKKEKKNKNKSKSKSKRKHKKVKKSDKKKKRKYASSQSSSESIHSISENSSSSSIVKKKNKKSKKFKR